MTNKTKSSFIGSLTGALIYPFRSGKNSKLKSYLVGVGREFTPRFILERHKAKLFSEFEVRDDKDYIQNRVNYYNKLETEITLSPNTPDLKDYKIPYKRQTYYIDFREINRYFDKNLKCAYLPGDIKHIPDEPTIVKSRPVAGDNANSVLLNLNKVRHFIFVNDNVPFESKSDIAIFRGKVRNKSKRQNFFKEYFGNPLFDLGDTSEHSSDPDEWKTSKMTIKEQLKYKFILSIEGNDVSSNLKWIMSSGSAAVMPKPEFETWFMEGTLIPGVHYIEIKPDYSDVEEKIRYYIDHPDETLRIIENANNYVKQFFNPQRELLISILVMRKYFEKTTQI